MFNSRGTRSFTSSGVKLKKHRDPSPTPPLTRLLDIPKRIKQSFIKKDKTTQQPQRKRFKRDPSPTPPLKCLNFHSARMSNSTTTMNLTRSYSSPAKLTYSSPEKPPSTIKPSIKKQAWIDTNETNISQEKEPNISMLNVKKKLKSKTDEPKISPNRDLLLKWIESLGIKFIDCEREEDFVQSFTNGVKLAAIVEKVTKKEIRGINLKPSNAAILNNINKSLEILKQNKNMNPRYLWSAVDIMKGNSQVIWGLIEDIYNV